LIWILVHSVEKDKFDAKDEKHKSGFWCKNWWAKHNDNVLVHFFVFAFLLIIVINNTITLLSKDFDMPQNLSHLGASGLIGFSSSLTADILKRMIKSVKKRVRKVSFS
tara:strand:- start:235 stop:558 length:324 start_codon:yes stop_codon:yes gene_type:complete